MFPCRAFPHLMHGVHQAACDTCDHCSDAFTLKRGRWHCTWDGQQIPSSRLASALWGCQGLWHVPGRNGTRERKAYLTAVDVKILQQLAVVNEGIEALKWLLEEKSTLTSRCSSLTSSQYSLVESQEASRRGSWDSVQDPNDKLDSISIGSYLDTLADDMDEYSQNAADPAAASAPGRVLARAEQDWARIDHDRGLSAKQEKGKAEHEWPHADNLPAGLPQDWSCPDQQRFAKEPQVANGHLGKQPSSLEPGKDTKLPSGAGERMGKGNPGGKTRKAEADFENCKLNSKVHLEYDAHWRWLQSQDDVTFL
ncbi:leucine rich adaptor protein 1 isoform X1 [Apteryx mantelli]|uniref:Leucine rich adaptor protein 1 n=2 Tax=Apteryx TaxID=8821 RepID=A0A8B9PJS9_APTOW